MVTKSNPTRIKCSMRKVLPCSPMWLIWRLIKPSLCRKMETIVSQPSLSQTITTIGNSIWTVASLNELRQPSVTKKKTLSCIASSKSLNRKMCINYIISSTLLACIRTATWATRQTLVPRKLEAKSRQKSYWRLRLTLGRNLKRHHCQLRGIRSDCQLRGIRSER